MRRLPKVGWRDYLVALALFAATFCALGLAQRDQGIMRDEATYFDAARNYWGWLAELGDNVAAGHPGRSLSPANIARYWRVNSEHPGLAKTLFGISWRLFHRRGGERAPAAGDDREGGPLGLISAFRLPGWIFTALGVALLYLFGVRIDSRLAGVAAALLYITIPRAFFHGQLACFDAPIATCWLAVVYAYVRSLSSARWGVLAGVAFGVALATKHNAWFLPPLLLIHYLLVIRPDISLRPLRLPRVPLAFISMAVLGPLIFWAHWPWLWFDTVDHLQRYFGFHLHHAYYNMEYLGRNWGPPPLPVSYPFIMTLFTVPTVTVVLACAGGWLLARYPLAGPLARLLGRRATTPRPAVDERFVFEAERSWLRPGRGLDPRLGTLFGVNALFPLALIALPSTPIFGGTKHWLPAYPFFALLGGVALGRLAERLRTAGRGWGRAALALPLLAALPGAIDTACTHPFGLSQYNALAGGVAGGADLGLNRQFWGYAPRQLLPWIDETFKRGARVYFHDVNYGAYRDYIRVGLLRGDIQYAGMELPAIRASDYAMVIHELHFNKYDYWIWDSYGTPSPTRVLQLESVPLVSVYSRPRDPAAAGGAPREDAAAGFPVR